MPTKAKYQRTTDLYTDGVEVVLDDGNVIYLRAMNPLERQEALGDAAAARGRLSMALREIDSDEQAKVKGAFYEDGREASITAIINNKTGEMISETAAQVRDEKEWKEKITIFDRSDELKARPLEDVERQLLIKIETEFLNEINLRYDNERENARLQYQQMGDDVLIEELLNQWAERRGAESGEQEFRLSEVQLAARACDGVRNDEGTWNHQACEGHQLRIWDTKAEVAALPDRLLELLFSQLAILNMSVREAKNLDRQLSSSDSSQLPSEPAESTPSTPDETPSDAPGTSPQLSSTP